MKLREMRQFLMCWFVQRVRKPLIRLEIEETGVGEGSRGVTKGGESIPPIFVTADSAGLKFSVSRLECADASDLGSADSKGLAGAEKAGTSLLARDLTKEAGNRFLGPKPPHPYIVKTLNRMRDAHAGKDPITMLVMTNHPGHYTKDTEISPSAHMLSQISLLPSKPANVQTLMALMQATNFYGRIPQELPKNG